MAESRVNSENYVLIQGFMVKEMQLKGNELLIYAIIYGFSQAENQVFNGSLQYLADWINGTRQTVLNCIDKLIEKGYIGKNEKIINGVKFCEYYSKILTGGVKKFDRGIQNFIPEVVKNFEGGSQKIRHNNINNNLYDNSINNIADNKKRKTTSYDLILSAVPDDSLRELYLEYIKMRKLIKSPMTERALTMLINKVNELEPNSIERQKQLLETAIMNNWKSVYPLKDNIQTKQQQGTGNIFLDMYIKENGGLCDGQSGNIEDILGD